MRGISGYSEHKRKRRETIMHAGCGVILAMIIILLVAWVFIQSVAYIPKTCIYDHVGCHYEYQAR